MNNNMIRKKKPKKKKIFFFFSITLFLNPKKNRIFHIEKGL